MRTNRYNLDFLKYLDYDESSPSGLRWSWRPEEEFPSRLHYDNFLKNVYDKTAGSLSSRRSGKYLIWITKIRDIQYLNSRIIYSIFNDDLHDGIMVDHIDGNSMNNKIDNLRLATRSQNAMNSNVQELHSIGAKGIRKKGSRFNARITLNKVLHDLGSFDCLEDAINARKNSEKELHKEFAKSL